MKIDTTEIAPSGKPRLKIYLGNDELKVMLGALLASLQGTPIMEETIGLRNQMRSMRQTLGQWLGNVEGDRPPGKRTRKRRAKQKNRRIHLGEIWNIVDDPDEDPTGELARIKGLMIGWDDPPPSVAQSVEATGLNPVS